MSARLRALYLPLCALTLAVSSVAASAIEPGSARAAGLRPLTLAFGDNGVFGASDPSVQTLWLQRSAALGAQVVRLEAGWPAVTRPAQPADPSDPAYDFAHDDGLVRAATAQHLTPLISFTGAPAWAEGPNRPVSAAAGSWLPDPRAVGAFGQALATRYDGHFPDPLHPGAVLPRVAAFQLWNEPNLPQYLAPQWQHRGRRWIGAAAVDYRLMLNAFYAGVKAAQPAAKVVTAGTAPYGDFGHDGRTMPVIFWSEVLSAPVSFDVLAHQPYGVAAPTAPALNPGDVSIPDIGKLTRLLRGAERRGAALPRGISHQIWVTETGYSTNPPNRTGVPVAKDARWLAQSLFVLWRQGVSLVTWFLIRDGPPSRMPNGISDTGVYYYGGLPKPAAAAYRFPLVGHRTTGGAVHAWVRAPATGTLVLEGRKRGRWMLLSRTAVRAAEVLDLPSPRQATALRASDGALKSPVWTF